MPVSRHPDVIVVGAGIAGLAAALELGRGGLSVCLLEARERIGGRIFSAHDATSNTDIPLGAEFIHGVPAEIWGPLRESGIEIQEIGGQSWCTSRGQLRPCDFFPQIDSILDKMDDSTPDESFLDFLESYPTHTAAQEEAQRRAIGYVTGFNAADASRVGVHWLVKGMKAEKRIQGERVFRPRGGYGALVEIFRKQTARYHPMVQTATLVEHVGWGSGHVQVSTSSRRGAAVLNASCVLITLPLSVLKAPAGQHGAVRFTPALPQQKRDAMDRLEMGKAIRVSLKFRKRFWDNISPSNQHGKTLSDMGFLFSQNEWFPTWWTTFPERLPVLTGWAPSRSAERLSGRERSFVIGRCLQSLAETLSQDSETLADLLEAGYFHDWQSDPFSCGAYSYGKVGADGAQEALARPVKNTLFFAGEATDIDGNDGTVHGGIASGYRAAREILQR